MPLSLPSRLRRLLAVVAAVSTAVGPAGAQLALKGELVLAEDFRRHETYTKEKLPVQQGWQVRVAHGIWTRTAEGVKSTVTPGHQPVLVFEGDFGDCVIEVDFRYQKGEPGQWGACRISATNPTLNPRAYAASVWANVDYKSRAVGLVLEHDEWAPGHITQVARKLADFLPDTWYTLRLELIGNRALAECNGVTVTGEYPKFGLPKSSLWLATGLSPHELRRLRVYRATPNPAWPPKKVTEAASAESAQQTSLVRLGSDGRLHYTANARGDVIPDFSGVGYANGDAPIPDVPAVLTLAPVAGDNTAHIQAAIDAVAKLPVQADGFRGAIHFRAGTYPLARQIKITAGGIVLRGDGTGPEGTHFVATGTTQYDLIHFTGTGGAKLEEPSRRRIVDAYVPIGATRVQVEAGHGFRVDEWVVVHHEPTEAWIELLGMAQYGWKASGYQHQSERRITRVDGDTVHLDAPIIEPLDPRYARAALVRIASTGRIEQCGIEHLRLTSRYASEIDEQHGWRGVVFNHVKNGWARHVVVQNFGYAAVSISSISCLWITVEHCQMLDPKSEPKGGRRYSFPLNGQRCLVQHCLARGGRHDFVSGARSPGPNVFHACLATGVVRDCDSGPHHRWNIGTLFDRIVSDMDLNVINRTSSGTGHGWTGAQNVLWNCTVRRALVQDPPGPFTNWAIGTIGEVGHVSRYSAEEPAVFESNGAPSRELPSLFEAQRHARQRSPRGGPSSGG